ncbi:hypothetical protein PPERSA_04982 [Pseudocohnilembus persalinus]|uniref:Succinyl-CoA:3-ketoacid-coenzyme A transferase n=1 Tax=Pseudocohnilembus persalinus TaxID=266149 RepID=A0A0V0QW18_PSEPJ|nr:hypothetical protein PPERSA_04982 [Pseudocohnilembus persalinus]|eukprot:KRX06369.1 hypothetical protein PPERSA_04982 [Pseudocohnilembus persalinus]
MQALRKLQKLNKNYTSTFVPKFFQSKVVKSRAEAMEGVKSGQTILVGGFGLCGTPEDLIRGVEDSKAKDLCIVSNNAGIADWGLGTLMKNHQIKRMVASYVGENKIFEQQYLGGQLEVELTPQGTLAEKCRAGGAGIPAFYTPTGAHTWVQTGEMPITFKPGSNGKVKGQLSKPKELRQFNGRDYILEESIFGDVALIKAWKADTLGNLVYRGNARNFNADMVTAAKLVIVEVEEIVEVGELDPNEIHTPAVYVDRIYKPEPYEKVIERPRYTKKDEEAMGMKTGKNDAARDAIMRRLVKEVDHGMSVNLGIGIPMLLPTKLPEGIDIYLQTENGSLGVGDYPRKGQADADFINAGKEPVTLNKGASIFSSSQSFAMIRGGHLDLTVLGAMQVSANADIASWIIPGSMVKGMGGAMDLVACGSKIVVTMEHVNKRGEHKLLKECELPLTGKGVINMVITDLAVFQNIDGKLKLTEISKDTTLEEVKQKTGFEIDVTDESQLKKF